VVGIGRGTGRALEEVGQATGAGRALEAVGHRLAGRWRRPDAYRPSIGGGWEAVARRAARVASADGGRKRHLDRRSGRTTRGWRRRRRWWHELASGGVRAGRRQRGRWVVKGGAQKQAAAARGRAAAVRGRVAAILTEWWAARGERKRGGAQRGLEILISMFFSGTSFSTA
jgi:hypothetical protein